MNRQTVGILVGVLLLILGIVVMATQSWSATVTAPDGVAIHYEVQGVGDPALVFVHGWSCDATYWREQVATFAADHRVVRVDLAGHGESGSERDDYTIAAFGQDVAAVLAAADVRDAILIGHSMGGPVVVETALLVPDRVRGLIGIDNFQSMTREMDPDQLAGFTAMLEADFAGTCEGWVRGMFPADADPDLVTTVAKDMAAAPPRVALSAITHTLAWMGGGGVPSLRKLPVNLICVNAAMHPTDTEDNRRYVPGFTVRTLDGVGHFLMLEKPEEFNALLAEAIATYADVESAPGRTDAPQRRER